MSQNKIIKTGNHKIEIGNPDKEIFPESSITKMDIVDYYRRIAKYFIHYSKKRPLSMKRYPDGIEKSGFFHKQVSVYFPDYIRRFKVKMEKGGSSDLAIVDEIADLIFLADQACIEIHTWLSTTDNIYNPDKIVFDLDPPEGKDFKMVKFAARKIKKIFEEKKMSAFVMTTGSKGLHVVIPIKPEYNFDTVRRFVKNTVSELAGNYPDRLTTETRKDKRKGRVFLDYLRNAYGQTTIAPYSLRAISGAPIATPLGWDELSSIDRACKYNIKNVFYRMGNIKDPWKDIAKFSRKLDIS